MDGSFRRFPRCSGACATLVHARPERPNRLSHLRSTPPARRLGAPRRSGASPQRISWAAPASGPHAGPARGGAPPRFCPRPPCREFVMANKMLIDATHPEETRVVVVRGSKVEDFDFEAANRRPLRGNIYLAKVTRVEPSLQAAFVEYGGNRHGFLPFSEIHPDYYQIPVADRQALLEEEARAASDEEREEEPRRHRRRRGGMARRRRGDEVVRSEAAEGDASAPEFAGDEIGETPISENAAGDAPAESEASANEAPAAEDFAASRAMDPMEHGTASAAAPEGDGAPEGGASALDAGPSDSETAPSDWDSVASDATARTTEAEPSQDAPPAEATAAAEDHPESIGEGESRAPDENASETAEVEARRDVEPNGDQE